MDELPELVADFVDGASSGDALLQVVQQHVTWMARPYPDAYFVLARKTDDAIEDLAHRTFATCAAVEKGRFPFSGRTPFVAFVQEAFEGRAIRYHSVYAKLSIARELLRDDYAKNLVRDPVLRWRAELYRRIGDVLKQIATKQPGGKGSPPRWSLGGPALVRPPEVVEAELRRREISELDEQVRFALRHGGPTSQAQLARLLEPLHDAPASDLDEAPEAADLDLQIVVRNAVMAGWDALEAEDRELLVALARGDSYDELIARHERFKHRVAVTRAVKKITDGFVSRLVDALGGNASPDTPLNMLETILGVLAEVVPELESP